jgi:hypothetical protein
MRQYLSFATTWGMTRVHNFHFFVFVFKQGLIKLHGIQKKEMY